MSECPYGQYYTETAFVPYGFKYKKCVDRISEIVLISIGFALLVTLGSFLISKGIMSAKIARQENKYIESLFPSITEDDDNVF